MKNNISTKYPSAGIYFFLLVNILFFNTILFAQTEIGIAPGEAMQLKRSPSVSIQPVTEVFVEIHGQDSLYVGAVLDSFKVISGKLNIDTWFTLVVSPIAPLGELNVGVRLIYSADAALTREVDESFIIDTSVMPAILADFSADIQQGDAPLTVQFSNESMGDIVGYVWDFGDENVSLAPSPQHTYTVPGVYTVSLTVYNFSAQNQAIKQDYIQVLDPTALPDEKENMPDDKDLVTNYPNPFNPVTNITFKLDKKSPVKIMVYDLNGRYQKTLTDGAFSAGVHTVTFNAEKFSSGVYLYRVLTNSYTVVKRMTLLR